MNTLRLTCSGEGCGRVQEIPAGQVIAVPEPAAVLALFFCQGCGAGWSRLGDPSIGRLVLHSGAEVCTGLRPARTLLGRPPVWPDSRPRQRVRDRFLLWFQHPQPEH